MNIVIIDGTVSSRVFIDQNGNRSIDFEIKNQDGHHQVISRDKDIIRNKDSISGRVKIFGKLQNLGDDGKIIAERIELL